MNVKKKVKKQEANFAGLASLAGIVIIIVNLFTVVPAGAVGVVNLFRSVCDNTLKAGDIMEELQTLIGPRGITIESVPLRQIVLQGNCV